MKIVSPIILTLCMSLCGCVRNWSSKEIVKPIIGETVTLKRPTYLYYDQTPLHGTHYYISDWHIQGHREFVSKLKIGTPLEITDFKYHPHMNATYSLITGYLKHPTSGERIKFEYDWQELGTNKKGYTIEGVGIAPWEDESTPKFRKVK